MSLLTGLDYLLEVIGLGESERELVHSVGITSSNHLRTFSSEKLESTLTDAGLSAGEVSFVIALKAWFVEWRSMTGKKEELEVAFSESVFDQFLDGYDPDTPSLRVGNDDFKSAAESSLRSVIQEVKSDTTNFKVDTRYLPRLPKGNKSVQEAFEDWREAFTTQMTLARVGNILDPDYEVPDPDLDEEEYQAFEMKDAFLKAAIVHATQETTAYSYLDLDNLSGRDNFLCLVRNYQGEEYLLDSANNAADCIEQLKFGNKTMMTADAFVAAYIKCIKQMKKNNTEFPTVLQKSHFLQKICHHAFKIGVI